MTKSIPLQPGKQAAGAQLTVERFRIFLPLNQETRSHVETACAAFHLNRKVQTLRSWACLDNGPLRPIRINGRLAWAVVDLKLVLSGGQ